MINNNKQTESIIVSYRLTSIYLKYRTKNAGLTFEELVLNKQLVDGGGGGGTGQWRHTAAGWRQAGRRARKRD